MAEQELRELADDAASLSEDALQALQNEITSRGLAISLNFSADEMGFRELSTICAFRDLPEAMLAKGILESAGIECSLADDNIVRMDWFYSNAVGGIKLQVAPADIEAANEVLQQPIPETFEVEGVGTYQQPRCPKCNSFDTVFEELNEGVAYTTAYFNLPLPIQDKGWKCKSCGHEWEPPEEPETSVPDTRIRGS
jgi:hypothetical protein